MGIQSGASSVSWTSQSVHVFVNGFFLLALYKITRFSVNNSFCNLLIAFMKIPELFELTDVNGDK